MEDTTLKKRNCRLVHCTFCEVFIVLVWLITGQKYKDMIMQYFIVSWWKIVIFYLGCLKCFTWDGQQSETAVFWGPARPKKAPQIWWKTQESYFFLYFWECVNMHFLLVSICVGRWELALFWKCYYPTFDWAGIFHKNSWWPVLDKGWSDLQRHWKHLRKCVSSGCTRGGLTQIQSCLISQ